MNINFIPFLFWNNILIFICLIVCLITEGKLEVENNKDIEPAKHQIEKDSLKGRIKSWLHPRFLKISLIFIVMLGLFEITINGWLEDTFLIKIPGWLENNNILIKENTMVCITIIMFFSAFIVYFIDRKWYLFKKENKYKIFKKYSKASEEIDKLLNTDIDFKKFDLQNK